MLIDWFTVGAQALNFLILVWLMKRFLYKPILHAIDEREKRIATELANADKKKAEAQKESDEFKHKNEEFDKQRAALLKKATDEAKVERQRLLDEARNAADALSSKRQEALRNEEHNLHQAISRRTEQEVFAITRKALMDLATVSLEERLGEVFTRRLREMDSQAKAGLGEALKKASNPALVRSAFDLPPEQRAAIQNALNETFSAEIHIRFETAPDLISGIELTTNGQKVAWSIADYLVSLQKGVEELLKEKDKAEVKAKTSSGLTTQIAKRAYELYEQQGRKSESANQNWSQAEREIRKGEAKAEPKPEAKVEAESETEVETKVESKQEVKTAQKPEVKSESKPEGKVKSKPEAEVEPEAEFKPEVKAEPKPVAKVKSKPEAEVEPEAEFKPEVKTEPKPEVKAEPKPVAKVESNPEVKAELKAEVLKPETVKQ
jgi:F-type H+-transporting ATPase subunit b